jgi:CBS domain-containing membrane protein
MLVRDLMQTEVATLKVNDSLGLADDIMQLGRIRHLPVVSAENKVVGIVSQRDLFRAAVSSVLGMRKATEREWLGRIPVRDVMTGRVATVPPTAPVRQAVEIMLEKRIGCLPVVENEVLVGLISESDFLRLLARVLEIPDVKEQLPELRFPD